MKKENINAFHPLYAKTYEKGLIDYFRLLSFQKEQGKTMSKHVAKKRKTVPSHGTIFGLSDKH